MERTLTRLDGVDLRHPTETDHPALRRIVEGWWGERSRGLLPRSWLRPFGSTSWLAEAGDGTTRLYGAPATAHYDGEREDRSVSGRELAAPSDSG